MKTLDPTEITLGVTCGGNIRSLCMALMSAINSRSVPHRILIRLETDMPGLNDFYLAQISQWAVNAGIKMQIDFAAPKGIRAARDYLLDECRTKYLWMIDDDVIVAPDCLEMLCRCGITETTAAIQACKNDVSNVRGYKDFSNFVHTCDKLADGANYNHRWDQWPGGLPQNALLPTYKVWSLDTGNVFFDVELLAKHNLRFSVFPDSTNCGGEDTLMAMQCYDNGLEVRFCPWAKSEHLEKPDVRFKEDAARCEAVSRSMDVLGMDNKLKAQLQKCLMAWAWK